MASDRTTLPFAVEIPIRSYLDYAFPLSIVSADPNHRSAVFGSFIQIFFPDDKLDYDRVLMLPSLRTPDWERLGFIETRELDASSADVASADALVETLVAHLHQGWYAEVHIDEYFLPARPCHRRVHSVHDNMIVGCDGAARVFLVAGYGRDYEVASFGFDDVARSWHEAPESQCARRRIRMIRRTPTGHTPFDLAAMASQLRDYLDSRVSVSPDEMHSAQLYWKARRFTGTWGLSAYAAFADYVTRTARDRVPLDLRVTRTLWEHKACMVARLEYLEGERCLPERPMFSQAYRPIESLARAVRFAAYEYNECGRDPRHAATIAEALQTMRGTETAVLRGVLASLN